MTSPFVVSSVAYGDAPQGGALMPMIIAGRNPSNTIDKQYQSGYLWLSSLDVRNSNGTTGSGNLYIQSGTVAGLPTWAVVSPASGAVNSLSSDGGTVVPPGGGDIALLGTANQISTTGSVPGNSITFSIPSNFIAPGAISSTTTMTVGTNLVVNGTSTFTGGITFSGNVSVGGTLDVIGLTTLAALTVVGTTNINASGAATTTIATGGTGALVLGNATGNTTLTGSFSTLTAAGTFVVGTAAQTGTTTIVSSTAANSVLIQDGINVGAQIVSISNGATAANSTVNILSGAGTAGAGSLLMANNPRVTVIDLGDVAPDASRLTTIGGGTVIVAAVTDTIDIGPDGATTNANSIKTVNVNTGGVTLGQVLTNIASGAVTSGTHTTAIASGNRAAGTMALNIMTGTGTKTANLGNADGLTTFNIDAVTLVNDSVNANTSINTGTSTGAVAVGNALAGAMTVDTAAGISLDAATVSNFTVTGAGADLNLLSVGGSILVEATEDAALAIFLHANGGVSETIQARADQGTGVASVHLLSDVGGITIAGGLNTGNAINLEANTAGGGIDIDSSTGGFDVLTTGAISLDSALASNFTTTGAGVDLTLSSVLGSVLVESTEDAALAIRLHANGGTSETIQIHSDLGTGVASIDLLSDVGGITLTSGLVSADAINLSASAGGVDVDGALQVNIASSQAAASAIVLSASNAAGGIDLTTGGGSVDISSAGFVTMVAATDTQASPTAASTLNVNVGQAIFTGFTTASAGAQVFTITNSIITTSSVIFVTACNEGANDAQMTVTRVKRLAGSMEVTLTNNGAAALNGNVVVDFWVVQA